MHNNRNPDIAGLHLCIAKEYSDSDTGYQLADNALQPGLGAVEKQVDRQVPEAPENTQQQNTCALSEPFLQHRLEEAPPSVLLSEKCSVYQEEIKGQNQKIKPCIGTLKHFKKHPRFAFK